MILLLGDASDPLLCDVAGAASRHGHDHLLLGQADLLDRLVVDDTITDVATQIGWTVDDRRFGSHEVCGVFNQLGDLDLPALPGTDTDERLFAWRELRAYLLFALGNLPNVLNPPAGQEMSAPAPAPARQWCAASSLRPPLAVPRWTWTPAHRAISVPGRRHAAWCPPLGPVSWLPPDPADDDAPGIAHEVPPGHRIDLSVLDRRILACRCDQPLPDEIRDRCTDVIARLPIPSGLRLLTVTLFVCPEPRLLTFGSLCPGISGDGLSDAERAILANGVVAAFNRPGRCRPWRTAASHTPQQTVTITPRWARHQPVDAPVQGRRRPSSMEHPDPGAVNIIAASGDPTAAHLYRRARRTRVPVTWWYAEEIEHRTDRLAELLATPMPRCGFYLRRPATADLRLEHGLILIDRMLTDYCGPVIGAGLDRSTNHSKALHTAALKRLGADVVRVPDSAVRSVVTRSPEAGTQVVKAISAAKTQVLMLDSVTEGAERRYTVPVMTQPRITGTNVRVHVVGEQVTAMTIGSSALDYRYGNFTVRWRRLAVEVARWCVAAARSEGLAFAGVDLIVTPDATYCLEVNPNPGYHVFEERLSPGLDRYRISDALLCYLNPGADHG